MVFGSRVFYVFVYFFLPAQIDFREKRASTSLPVLLCYTTYAVSVLMSDLAAECPRLSACGPPRNSYKMRTYAFHWDV
jgi:hypothetical protein